MGEPLPQQAGAGSGEQVLPDPQSALLRHVLVLEEGEMVLGVVVVVVLVVEEIMVSSLPV